MLVNKTSYSELLDHPKWHKKKLDILEKSGFKCISCSSNEKTLDVYHSYYVSNLKPWEYPNNSLYCLCGECYNKSQYIITLIKRQLRHIELAYNERLFGYLYGLETLTYPMVTIGVMSYEVAQGIGDCWKIPPEVIIENLRDGHIDGYTLRSLSKNTE
ncbi:MAG: hypothetical protein WGN25_06785 [Candidatus Electrothrix sp. GW3-4]|uniref:hypothetical protein n=1 Tax=Candidatus Electrothrix sp. GW3-4 TaxID=3126740 RepID=UPI0030CF6EFD